MVSLGTQLRVARKKRGWTQQALANRVGLSMPTIWALETDKTKPDLDTILRVIVELGVKLEFAVSGRLVSMYTDGLSNERAKKVER